MSPKFQQCLGSKVSSVNFILVHVYVQYLLLDSCISSNGCNFVNSWNTYSVMFIFPLDPCMDFTCKIGWECVVDRINNEPFCDCATSCPVPEDTDEEVHRTHVCSTANTTYASLCEFHRQKCLNAALDDAKVDYYGGCTGG